MGLKLQGLAEKIKKLQHEAEAEAVKLDAKVEEVAAKLPTVFSGAHGAIDGLASQVGDVEKLLEAVQAVSNGGPDLVEVEPSAPQPPADKPIWPAHWGTNGNGP
jgi:hypothetical protein